MNAEDCPQHAHEIDKTIFYPWTCGCEPDHLFELVECTNGCGCFPLMGAGQTPQDEGSCPLCGFPVDWV